MSGTVPVTVVTGFLGAGKTTLVNQWLAQAPRGDVAVIVNEYGHVGVDGELLAGRARLLVEISGGCVCCTTQAELARALDALASRAEPPCRILIETSGAASPAGVLRCLVAGARRGAFGLDGVITVFDATRIEHTFDHALAFEQLGYADVVVLTRAELCDSAAISHAKEQLLFRNQGAAFVEAARGQILAPGVASLGDLLDLRHTRASELAGPSPRVTPRYVPTSSLAHVYESVALCVDGEVDGERFADFVESDVARFAGRIFRIKGIIAVAGLEARMVVQGVTDSVEIDFADLWGAAKRHSRLVVIGFGLDREALERGFEACVVAPASETGADA